ncbi:MAG: hypothetical protein JST00_25285 [Deltaproteobacteria bacterium]|nr:hypothetical protein [Deltaproteobacteria bacterium]
MRGLLRSFVLSLAPAALVLACGGATTTVPDPSSSSGSSGASSSSGSSGASSSGASSGGQGCTAIGCASGFAIEFSFNQAGTYVVALKLDDAEVTCKATIPIRGTDSPCSRSDVLLTLSGSALPASQQSIGGIQLTTTTAKKLAIEVFLNDRAIASGAWDPIPYVTSPGPNGPGCEPATCTSGSVKLISR